VRKVKILATLWQQDLPCEIGVYLSTCLVLYCTENFDPKNMHFKLNDKPMYRKVFLSGFYAFLLLGFMCFKVSKRGLNSGF